MVIPSPAVPTNLPNAPVPVFPLAGVFLFPHQVLPLHVFEPRYRTMVNDLLDGPGRLVMGTLANVDAETAVAAAAADIAPPIAPVAGLGEILRHERLPDGRYTIWVMGLARVHIEEVPSDRPYRQVRCLPFPEVPVPANLTADLTEQLRSAAAARLPDAVLPDHTPPALLTDLLLQTLRPGPDVLARAFTEPSVLKRARYVLRQAAQAPERDSP